MKKLTEKLDLLLEKLKKTSTNHNYFDTWDTEAIEIIQKLSKPEKSEYSKLYETMMENKFKNMGKNCKIVRCRKKEEPELPAHLRERISYSERLESVICPMDY